MGLYMISSMGSVTLSIDYKLYHVILRCYPPLSNPNANVHQVSPSYVRQPNYMGAPPNIAMLTKG